LAGKLILFLETSKRPPRNLRKPVQKMNFEPSSAYLIEFPGVVLFIAYGPVKSLGMDAGENGKANEGQGLEEFEFLPKATFPYISRLSGFLRDYP